MSSCLLCSLLPRFISLASSFASVGPWVNPFNANPAHLEYSAPSADGSSQSWQSGRILFSSKRPHPAGSPCFISSGHVSSSMLIHGEDPACSPFNNNQNSMFQNKNSHYHTKKICANLFEPIFDRTFSFFGTVMEANVLNVALPHNANMFVTRKGLPGQAQSGMFIFCPSFLLILTFFLERPKPQTTPKKNPIYFVERKSVPTLPTVGSSGSQIRKDGHPFYRLSVPFNESSMSCFSLLQFYCLHTNL